MSETAPPARYTSLRRPETEVRSATPWGRNAEGVGSVSITSRPHQPARAAVGLMPDRLVKIGELSEMLNLTRRAIRHYEDRGLVQAIRGPAGVRLFDQAARRRLEWIASLRLTGIGLRDIDEILSLDPRDEQPQLHMTLRKLEGRAAVLKNELRAIEAALETLRATLGEPAPKSEARGR